MRNIVENVINGAAIYLMGRDIIESNSANNVWKNLYEAKSEEVTNLKNEMLQSKYLLIENHNAIMSFMQQNQAQEEENYGLKLALRRLSDEVEALGLQVSDDYTIIVPQDDLEGLLDEDEDALEEEAGE